MLINYELGGVRTRLSVDDLSEEPIPLEEKMKRILLKAKLITIDWF